MMPVADAAAATDAGDTEDAGVIINASASSLLCSSPPSRRSLGTRNHFHPLNIMSKIRQ